MPGASAHETEIGVRWLAPDENLFTKYQPRVRSQGRVFRAVARAEETEITMIASQSVTEGHSPRTGIARRVVIAGVNATNTAPVYDWFTGGFDTPI
jgi:hypothetical protein